MHAEVYCVAFGNEGVIQYLEWFSNGCHLAHSLREEFLIPGKNFVPGRKRNWGGNAVDEKTLSFYYLFINTTKTA